MSFIVNMYNTDELKYIIAGAVVYGRMEASGEIESLSDDELTDFLLNQTKAYYAICESFNYSPPYHEFIGNALKNEYGW